MAATSLRSNARILMGAALITLASACHHGRPADPSNPDARPLGAIAGQPLLVTPVQSFRIAPELGWTALPRPADILASLDRAITDSLRDRVRNQQWVYAEGLMQSSKTNPTYATDPRSLSIQALRSPKLKIGDRLTEPLASQLRTMLALHEGRLILIPIELRFEHTATGPAHPVLHLVLVDPRLSNVTWIGDVPGPDAPTYSATFVGPIASALADLFVAK